MARSRIFVIGVVAGVPLAFLAACNAVLGLGDYEKVDADGGAADAANEADVTSVSDAPIDALIDVEAGTYDPTRAWANWPMPNPLNDAGYPNEASYDAGGDSGTVFDNVTQLGWENTVMPPSATSVTAAQTYCAGLRAGSFAGANDWRLPTRIELVSLIDYTRGAGTATIDPLFASTPREAFWSASPVGGVGAGNTFTVDFNSGEVHTLTPASARVRCVRGGKARLP